MGSTLPSEILRLIFREATRTHPIDVTSESFHDGTDELKTAQTFDPQSLRLSNQHRHPWRHSTGINLKPPVDHPVTLKTKLALTLVSRGFNALAVEYLYESLYVRCGDDMSDLARYFERTRRRREELEVEVEDASSSWTGTAESRTLRCNYIYIYFPFPEISTDLEDVRVKASVSALVDILNIAKPRGAILTFHKKWEASYLPNRRYGPGASSTASEREARAKNLEFWSGQLDRIFAGLPSSLEHLELDSYYGLLQEQNNSNENASHAGLPVVDLIRRTSGSLRALRIQHRKTVQNLMVIPPLNEPICFPQLLYLDVDRTVDVNSFETPAISHFTFDYTLSRIQTWARQASSGSFTSLTALYIQPNQLLTERDKPTLRTLFSSLPSLKNLCLLPPLVLLDVELWDGISSKTLQRLELHFAVDPADSEEEETTHIIMCYDPDRARDEITLLALEELPRFVLPFADRQLFPALELCEFKSIPYSLRDGSEREKWQEVADSARQALDPLTARGVLVMVG